MLVIKQLLVAIDIHTIFVHTVNSVNTSSCLITKIYFEEKLISE